MELNLVQLWHLFPRRQGILNYDWRRLRLMGTAVVWLLDLDEKYMKQIEIIKTGDHDINFNAIYLLWKSPGDLCWVILEHTVCKKKKKSNWNINEEKHFGSSAQLFQTKCGEVVRLEKSKGLPWGLPLPWLNMDLEDTWHTWLQRRRCKATPDIGGSSIKHGRQRPPHKE